jgi:hypothetical protein
MSMSSRLLGSKSTVALREKLIECFAASEALIAKAVQNFESQPERTLEAKLVLSQQLVGVLDQLLRYENWDVSPFATQLLKPTRKKRAELLAFIEDNSGRVSTKVWKKPICKAGFQEAYILLYQSSGADLRGWESQVTDLHRMAVSRPLYAYEEDVQRAIRYRNSPMTDGYALLHLPSDYLQVGPVEHKDKFGQNLLQFRKTNLQPSFVKAFYYEGNVYELEEGSLVKMKRMLKEDAV